ncbi:tRNA-binding protein [Paraeggerthella sp. Marseille-Q4926]|uniref:tRNA-binding protein n=1 Tax=Paraeggerthella TaxID=651554 RepID=UPI001CE41F9E|nr:tRNA-binding protein [Paraeggerthella sp. Marseille-Q4926]MDY3980260.1 tRNA-binding protein [Paraeggerthella sp.]
MVETIETAPVKPLITIDDLDKLDIRVGHIVLVEDVEKSSKLIKMTVDFGGFTRTILSGMKEEREDPKAEIEGKQALFVVNLAPRKMAGEVSEGMIYDIGYEDGILPVLAVPERDVPNGVRLG